MEINRLLNILSNELMQNSYFVFKLKNKFRAKWFVEELLEVKEVVTENDIETINFNSTYYIPIKIVTQLSEINWKSLLKKYAAEIDCIGVVHFRQNANSIGYFTNLSTKRTHFVELNPGVRITNHFQHEHDDLEKIAIVASSLKFAIENYLL